MSKDLILSERIGAVDDLVNFGVKVGVACRKVGIPRSSYYAEKAKRQKKEVAPLPGPEQGATTKPDDARAVIGLECTEGARPSGSASVN